MMDDDEMEPIAVSGLQNVTEAQQDLLEFDSTAKILRRR